MLRLKQRFSLNKSGIVLMTVMIVLLVMTIIIAGVVFITVANLENSQKTATHTETYYVAEGGVNYLTSKLQVFYATAPTTSSTAFFTAMDNYVATYPISNKQIVSFANNNGKTSQALVWIEPDQVNHRYKLCADGYIGTIRRTLSKIIEVGYLNGGLAFNDAVMAVGRLDIGGAYINGTVQTNSTANNSITFRGGTVVGAYIPSGTVPTAVVSSSNYDNSIPGLGTSGIYQIVPPTINPITVLPAPSTINKLKVKTFGSGSNTYQLVTSTGDLQITSSSNLTVPTIYNIGDENPGQSTFYVPNLKITRSAPNFTLEVNRNITLVTDTLWLNNTLKVTGTGKLTIFVKPYASNNSTNSQLQINASGIVGNQSDSTKMSVYVGALTYKSGSSNYPWELILGSGNYYFSLICANLDIDLNSVVLRGIIATNGANVFIGPSSASSAILLFAPNAVVQMKSSSSSFYGAIVAESFLSSTGNSHPTVTYDSAVNTYIPTDVIDLSGFNSPPTITFVKSSTVE